MEVGAEVGAEVETGLGAGPHCAPCVVRRAVRARARAWSSADFGLCLPPAQVTGGGIAGWNHRAP